MHSDDYVNGNNDVDLMQNNNSHSNNTSNGIIMEMSRESSLNNGNNSNIMYSDSRPSAGKYYLDQGRDSYNNNNNGYNDYDDMLP